jgi:peroxidase
MEGLWLVVLVIFVMALSVQSQLKTGFYSTSCSKAEAIVRSTVESYFKKDPTIAAGLLRLHFHDCFVQVYIYIYIYSPPPLACLYNCQ